MAEKAPFTLTNHATETKVFNREPERQSPHFDAAAVKQARAAVPLAEIRSSRTWPLALMALMVLAGLAGGVIGGLLSTGYLRRDQAQPVAAQTVSANSAISSAVEPMDEAVAPSTAAESEGPVVSSSATEEPIREVGPTGTATGDQGQHPAEESSGDAQPQEPRAALRSALNEWVAATNARDLGKQMSFYRPVMNAFYQRRNARLSEVRADRARVFQKANSIQIQAEAPVIKLSPDGREATMRFRKRYTISGGGQDRSGEVVQELRWQRVNGQWLITSERDLKVVN